MIRYGSTVMLIGGGPGTDIWTFNTIASTWQQRATNLAAARYDVSSVLYETPDRKRRYAIVVGGAQSVEYFDVDAPGKEPVSEVISGNDGPRELSGSFAMFLHDSHLFVVGGIGTDSSDGQSGMMLTIVRVTATSDSSALSFAYVPTYTPYAVRMAATNGENRTGTDGGDEKGGAKPLTAGEIAWIAVGVGVVLLAVGAFFFIRRRRQQNRGKSTMGRGLERESLVTGGSTLHEPAGSEVHWPSSPVQQQQQDVATPTPFNYGLTLLLPPAEAENPPMQLQHTGGSQNQVPIAPHDASGQGAMNSSPYVLAQMHPIPFAHGQPMLAQSPPVLAHDRPTAATGFSQEQRPIPPTAGPDQWK
ncbi:hypothetical protein GGF32_005678 [Allomyces javanicus]|nr:hypothetical protein GGF32_005678 [Allomyces javanicus]